MSIFANPLAKPSSRIKRWCLRLQQYNFTVEYQKGSGNPADYMSRHPVQTVSERECKIAEEYLNFVCKNACPKAITCEQVEKATENDPVLQSVKKCLINDSWYNYDDEENIQ